MKVRESEECIDCAEKDTIIHYLYECREVQQFWQRVVKWFDEFTSVSLDNLSTAQFMFGVPKTTHGWRTVNWVLLVVKFFIQRQKLFNRGGLHLIHFLAHIREKLITERKVCSMERRPDKFRKWQQLLAALS